MRPLVSFAGFLVLVGSLGVVLFGLDSEDAASLGPAPRVPAAPARSDSAPEASPRTAATRGAISFDAWFARGERLVPVRRTHAATPRVATAAVAALLAGPSAAERRAGLTTAIPDGTRLLGIAIRDGVATVDLTSAYEAGGGSLGMQVRLAQVVYTLTQFPTVRSVRFQLDGAPVSVFSGQGIVLEHPVGRADYRELAPAVAPVAGTWSVLPPAPTKIDAALTAAWTGRQLLLYGVTGMAADGSFLTARNAASAYDPAARTWRRLSAPPGPAGYLGRHSAVWTGRKLLVWGGGAYDPASRAWRRLPQPLGGGGLVVWTGREMLGWGGGCCGDVVADGSAYEPAAGRWRRLARSPLAGSQEPIGAWTGTQLIVLVGDRDPSGRRWPARLARAAAYDPALDRWRRIAPLPEPRRGASALWDGKELLVVGGAHDPRGGRQGAPATVGFAYDPALDRWRRLAAMPAGRVGAAPVWTGTRLLLWGGQTAVSGALRPARQGLAYDPATDRWAVVPAAPLSPRLEAAVAWTGRQLLVWGGTSSACNRRRQCHRLVHVDGAAFTPAGP